MSDAEICAEPDEQVKDLLTEIRLMNHLKKSVHVVGLEDHCVEKHKDDSAGYDVLIRMELLTPIKTNFQENESAIGDVVRLAA